MSRLVRTRRERFGGRVGNGRVGHHRGRHDHDRGAAATIVAVLLAGGVLLGMTALVVDVGQIYAEREELLSVADATAFNTALDCAFDRPECNEADALSKSTDTYADAIVRDGLAEVKICGSGPLPPCDNDFDPVGNLTDCLGDRPSNGAGFVEVHVTTLRDDTANPTILPASFAQTIVNGHSGSTVGACSRVAYGGPAGGLAVTLSICEWSEATGNGTAFPPPGAPDDVLADYEVAITFVNPNDEGGPCGDETGGSGWDAPGGFGWLDDNEINDCMAEIVENEYGVDTGNNVPDPCDVVLADARANRTVLALPVFSDKTGQGINAKYTLEGMAAFVVTGYNLPALSATSTVSDGHLCGQGQSGGSGSPHCIYGYFTQELVEWTGPIGGSSDLGAMVVRTVG